MDFYNSILSNNINIFGIDGFDIKNWHDANQIKNVYRCLFSEKDILYFSFRSEENLTDEIELKRLKVKISEVFKKEGEYIVLRQLDDARFDSVARTVVNESTFDLLFDIWNYFYSCTFFIPKDGFTFLDYIDFQKKIKFQDRGGEKLLDKGYSNFECIKGLGGDILIISYQKCYQLPDLKKAALDTPDKNQTFR